MDDIRKINYGNKLKRRANMGKFFMYLKKNWFKMILLTIILTILFYPQIAGSIVGDWLNKLIISFLQNLTF